MVKFLSPHMSEIQNQELETQDQESETQMDTETPDSNLNSQNETPPKAPTQVPKNNKKQKKPKITTPMNLSPELADIVGKKVASRAECIKELWAYIKKNKLQDPENKSFVVPDKKMAKIFGNDRMRGFGMSKFLSAHLS